MVSRFSLRTQRQTTKPNNNESRKEMKEQFQLLKDFVSLTKKSIETVANDSACEKGMILTSCADTLQAKLCYIDALELMAQTYISERNALLTFINNKGLLNEFLR